MKSTIISLVIVGVISLFLFFGWGSNSLPVKYLQYYKNLGQNDNHLNFANHEYGYNFMMSTELNGIFMTEGGDNQVFSLLYFATAERKRPDVDFFDQKGNVFPRLYGDLLNTLPDELRLIRDIRDYQLFSTDRPVYLTWRRPGLENLNLETFKRIKKDILQKAHPVRRPGINNRFRLKNLDELKYTARNMVKKKIFDLNLRSGGNLADQDFKYLGPWYYKRFGIVFRVTPIRYAIVDGLDASNGFGIYQNLVQYVKIQSKITLTQNQFDFYINQLVSEGYVVREPDGQTIRLLRPFRANGDLESIDYWNHYQLSHFNVENADEWDFLTREIFGNYIRRSHNNYNEQAIFYRNKSSFTSDSNLKNQFNLKAQEFQKKAIDSYGLATTYNYDNPYMIYNYAKSLLANGRKEDAAKYFAASSKYDYRFVAGYLDGVRTILNLLPEVHDKESIDRLTASAQDYLNKFFEAKNLLYSSSGNVEGFNQDREVEQAKNLEKQLKGIQIIPQTKIDELEQISDNDPAKIREFIEILKQRGERRKVIEQYDRLIQLEPQNFDNYTILYNYSTQNGFIDKSIDVLQRVLQNYNQLEGRKPPAWSLYYNLGKLYFDFGNAVIKNNQRDQGLNLFRESKKFLNDFIEQGRHVKEPENLKRLADAENILKQLDQILP